MKLPKLIMICLILALGISITVITKEESQTSYYEKQITATNTLLAAFAKIRERRLELGIDIDSYLDPLETGIIGIDAPVIGNSITTTLGTLEAKRTSTNPNFVALIIRYLNDLGLKEGDEVAVNFSSSFPALNIATIIALDALKLNSVIQSSLGASTYGANIIEFNYFDMELLLYQNGIIKRKSDLISLGGEKDVLDGIKLNDEEFLNEMLNKYKSNYDTIKESNLQKNIDYRLDYYHSRISKIKCFINVGGNVSGFGIGIKSYPNGLTRRLSVNISRNSGLIDYFLRDDVPLINLLNINDLAQQNDMEINNSTPYEIGIGKMFLYERYNLLLISITLMLVFTVINIDCSLRRNEMIEEGMKI